MHLCIKLALCALALPCALGDTKDCRQSLCLYFIAQAYAI